MNINTRRTVNENTTDCRWSIEWTLSIKSKFDKPLTTNTIKHTMKQSKEVIMSNQKVTLQEILNIQDLKMAKNEKTSTNYNRS